ncbi:hypothetical protein [Brevundimonas sp.]|uniref:hypothetical protein n=1 Tax=Brevundimonas sp. TaxID=1871086 RepID=UPI003A8CA36A
MTDAQRLFGVRLLHTVIYVVMATASLLVLYGGISGAAGTWLTVAVALVVIETLVFTAGGLKCPLTAVAVKYGAGQDGLFDTFLPERFTRHTFRIFGPIILLGLLLLTVRQWSAAG